MLSICFKGVTIPSMELGTILRDIKVMSTNFASFRVMFLLLSCNEAAHKFARHSLRVRKDVVWTGVVSPCALNEITFD